MVLPLTLTRLRSSRSLENATDHFTRTTDNPPNLLAGHLDLHAVRVGHGIGLLAQFQQATCDTSGDVEKCEIADLAGGIAQALCDLSAQDVKNVRVLQGQFSEFGVADFCNFTFNLGPYPGTALLLLARLLEQPQLTKKISGIEVGDDHFPAVVILYQDSDRALDDEKQRLGTISRTNDVVFGWIAAALAMHQEFVEILDLERGSNGNHGCIPKDCAV